jgi:hypothetical protein
VVELLELIAPRLVAAVAALVVCVRLLVKKLRRLRTQSLLVLEEWVELRHYKERPVLLLKLVI